MDNEEAAKFIAELINGGEFYDKRWYTEEQRDLWRKHAAEIAEALVRKGG